MRDVLFHGRRVVLSYSIQQLLRLSARRRAARDGEVAAPAETAIPDNPRTPEDFRPLENACFQDPYAFYRMLRDEYPVYQLANGIYCVSRFEDIVTVSRDTETYSSTHQGVIAGLRKGSSVARAGEKLAGLARLGIVPGDVLALSDQPKHTNERKVAHRGLNSRVVKAMEDEVEVLCREMMDEFIAAGEVEFMSEFAWRLPMRLIIRMLGFPEADYEKIKDWCVHGIATQSGISSPAELAYSRSEMMAFFRYCWRQFLRAKREPREDLSAIFVRGVADGAMDEQTAVSGILQLLLAGSDSSATSMGNALKLLIENPQIQEEVRADIDGKLPAFIEEVFRLEAAFQGHFRWTKCDTELAGVKLPADSRIFLMWASGNRDERVFDEPDKVRLDRPNGKKHLTFGHGIHACIGRELARTEIRIVLREFLLRTDNLRIAGPAPFMASMFAHTLQCLPVRFDARH
ncbi:cytochrome P450 [Spongiibacter sp.]|uniref:cytochrome P450 n=1 Tax=Spongiibacter sp. TaxID=2024860 RepID=UPI00356A86BE